MRGRERLSEYERRYAVKRALGALLALVLVCAFPHAAGAEEASVRVIQVKGPWLIGGALVSDNATVVPGSRLELSGGLPADQQRRATIQLVYGDRDGHPRPWSCRGDEPCAKGTTVPDGSPLAAAFKPIAKALSLVRPAIVPEFDIRGLTQFELSDGVVRREKNALTLKDVLVDVDPGTYRLVVTRPDETGSWRVVADAPVAIASGGKAQPSSVSVSGAGDGLYGLQVFSASGSGAVSNVAWIVAQAPPGDEARRSVYASAVAFVANWPAADRSFASAFLRRVLAGLADPSWSAPE